MGEWFRHYYKLIVLCQFFLWVVPVYFWNESMLVAFYVACNWRLVGQLHGTWWAIAPFLVLSALIDD